MPLYFTFQRANSALSTLCGITNFSQQLNNFDTIKSSVTERRIMSLGTCSQVLEAGFTLICYIVEQFVVYVASENNEVNCIFRICRERLGGIWKSFNFCPQRVTFKDRFLIRIPSYFLHKAKVIAQALSHLRQLVFMSFLSSTFVNAWIFSFPLMRCSLWVVSNTEDYISKAKSSEVT